MCRHQETPKEREERLDRQAKEMRFLRNKILTRRALREAGKMVVPKRRGRVTAAMRRDHVVDDS